MKSNSQLLYSKDDASTDPAVAIQGPLAGKIVAIVHPAWHSCGSHSVFVSQARAYQSLGAKVLSIALASSPGCVNGTRGSKAYFSATGDLNASIRLFAGMPLRHVVNAAFPRACKEWLHGNHAAMQIEVSRLTPLPEALASIPQIDLIHCNHFFSMPVAARLRARYGCPVVLDTHDVQAHQYVLRNRGSLTLPPAASFEDMLAIECEAMRGADILVHLNREEEAVFQKILPDKSHALLYPAVGAMPAGTGGGPPIIVASANYPNFLGLTWFLREVLPLAPSAAVQIFGNIDRMLRWRAPILFKAHAGRFRGKAEAKELDCAYRDSAAVLLPATAGHGISIKTIEALSCGAPLVATPLAFRGFPAGANKLPNVIIADRADGFAAALRSLQGSGTPAHIDRASSPTRRYYEQHFSFSTYRSSLLAIAQKALAV
ncbi:MAG: glycosyltransferase [Beijerinckiaceae bacterium]|nr:glycosyltransferase [Beijerinckiaceae bacterium]